MARPRVRQLNAEEVSRLLNALPSHPRQLARFALATGLRQANVLRLQWSEIDLARRTAWVHAEEAKGGEAIGVPLHDEAMAVLQEENGKHRERVFTFKGRSLGQVNMRSWRNAHFAPEQLRSAATRLSTFLGTPGSAENAQRLD